ncbi:pilus assembly PilX family protein [Chitinilyticum litopenaei]|uniref:pilus assembly PilX family protein n=1 Tax=Chitinilyticum litopenaei TaxID=1121276 RepID=UPI00048F32BC|nr:hypothetical protein [Chitinilyticum litopenaei]
MIHSARRRNKIISMRAQKGLATLLVAVVMLIVLAFITLYSNRAVFIEQKTTVNQIKKALAHEAAQSGLEQAFALLQDGNSAINYKKYFDNSSGSWRIKSAYDYTSRRNGNGSISDFSPLTGKDPMHTATLAAALIPSGTTGSSHQSFSVYLIDSPITSPRQFRLVSRGCSDSADCSQATAVIVQDFALGGKANPRCALDINGNVAIANNSSIHGYTSDTRSCGAHVGGNINDGGGNSGNRAPPNYDIDTCNHLGSCPAEPGLPSAERSPSTKSGDAFFESFFNATPATVKDASHVITGDVSTQAAFESAINAAKAAGKQTLWISGNLTLPWGTNIGNLGYCSDVSSCKSNSVTVIVNGNFDFNGVMTMWGLLYVRGSTNVQATAGALNITGAMAFEGSLAANASLRVNADDNVINGQAEYSSPKAVEQSWRDF